MRTGKYLSTISKGPRNSEDEDGSIVATKDAAFDWFVTEIFHEIPVKRDCSEEKFVQLTNRFDQPIQIDSEKRLYSGLSGEGAVFAIEMVSDGYNEAVCLAQKADTVILALGCHPMVYAKEEIDRTTLALPSRQQTLADFVECNWKSGYGNGNGKDTVWSKCAGRKTKYDLVQFG